MDQNRRNTFALALLPMAASLRFGSASSQPDDCGPSARCPTATPSRPSRSARKTACRRRSSRWAERLRSLTLPVQRQAPAAGALAAGPSRLSQGHLLSGPARGPLRQPHRRRGIRARRQEIQAHGQQRSATRCTAVTSASASTSGRCWASAAARTRTSSCGHRSPAGINGFPGNLDVTALISVYENTLTLAVRGDHRCADAHQLHLASVLQPGR